MCHTGRGKPVLKRNTASLPGGYNLADSLHFGPGQLIAVARIGQTPACAAPMVPIMSTGSKRAATASIAVNVGFTAICQFQKLEKAIVSSSPSSRDLAIRSGRWLGVPMVRFRWGVTTVEVPSERCQVDHSPTMADQRVTTRLLLLD